MMDTNGCRRGTCTALRFWGLALATGLVICEVIVLITA
jgi:hypothetical protein